MPSRGGRGDDHSPTGHGHARVGPATVAPNTLTLDNWFASMSTQEGGKMMIVCPYCLFNDAALRTKCTPISLLFYRKFLRDEGNAL